MKVLLPVREQFAQPALFFGWCIDDLTRVPVFQAYRYGADVQLHACDQLADFDGDSCGQGQLLESFKAVIKCGPIPQCFFGCGVAFLVAKAGFAKERIVRGDDILDLGTIFRF